MVRIRQLCRRPWELGRARSHGSLMPTSIKPLCHPPPPPTQIPSISLNLKASFHADLPSCLLAFWPQACNSICSSYGTVETADKNRVIAVADDDSQSRREETKKPANCFAISSSQGHLGPRTCLFPCCSISKVLVLSVVCSTGRAKGRPRQTDSQSVAAHRPTEAVLPPAGAVSKGAISHS